MALKSTAIYIYNFSSDGCQVMFIVRWLRVCRQNCQRPKLSNQWISMHPRNVLVNQSPQKTGFFFSASNYYACETHLHHLLFPFPAWGLCINSSMLWAINAFQVPYLAYTSECVRCWFPSKQVLISSRQTFWHRWCNFEKTAEVQAKRKQMSPWTWRKTSGIIYMMMLLLTAGCFPACQQLQNEPKFGVVYVG